MVEAWVKSAGGGGGGGGAICPVNLIGCARLDHDPSGS